MPREELVARFGRHDRACGRVGGDHRDVVIMQPRNRPGRNSWLAAIRRFEGAWREAELPSEVTGVYEHDVARFDAYVLCGGCRVEFVGSDRKAGLEMFHAEVPRDVDHDGSPHDAARQMVHAEAARPTGRCDQPSPVTVVEGRVAADVTEAVELRRCL